MPRSDRARAWLQNLQANPELTFHLKGDVSADLQATARVVTDPLERRAVFDWVATHAWKRDPEAMLAHSPLVEVTFQAPQPDPGERHRPGPALAARLTASARPR